MCGQQSKCEPQHDIQTEYHSSCCGVLAVSIWFNSLNWMLTFLSIPHLSLSFFLYPSPFSSCHSRSPLPPLHSTPILVTHLPSHFSTDLFPSHWPVINFCFPPLLPSSVQTAGSEDLWWYWGGGQLEVGAGLVSHPELGHLLLLRLEGHQVNGKG